MIKSRETAIIVLFFVILLWALSCSANQTKETYIFKKPSKKLDYARSPVFLLAQALADSIRLHSSESLKLKSPAKARFLAIFPGIVFHGLGSYYAGEKGMGRFCFGCEIVGIGLLALGTTIDDPDIAFLVNYPGGFLFLIPWIYDVDASPSTAKEHNKKILEKQKVGFKFGFNKECHSVCFLTCLSF